MRRYNSLTNEELVALTEEETTRLIEVEIAYAGVEFIPEPTLEEYETVSIEPTEEGYCIGSLIFANMEDAIAVSKMPRKHESYLSGDYHRKYLTDEEQYGDDNGIKTKRFYKKEDLLRNAEALQAASSAKERNKSATEKYQKFVKATQEIRSGVYDKIREARDWLRTVENANKALDKYRDLSQGDETVSMRFFVDAYMKRCDGDEIIEAILGQPGLEMVKVLENEANNE